MKLLPFQHLNLFDDYDVIMPPIIDDQQLDYDMGSEKPFPFHVGHGTFGDVFRVRLKSGEFEDTNLCIKEICSENATKHEIVEEARKLLFLSDTTYVPLCYGIVKFHNRTLDSNSRSFGILQEFIGEGITLHKFLRQQSAINKSNWISIAFQLARGLDKFHDKKILVNDIKPNNIVMHKKRNGYRLKYVDFGLASYRIGRKFLPICNNMNKLKHLAPEVKKGRYTSKSSDMYSLGCILRQISYFGCVKDLLLVSHMCMREIPSHRLTAHTAKILIENVVDN